MKKMISLAMLLAVAVTTFSQQTNPSPVLTKQDYLERSKNQKKAAFILLGLGGTCIAIAAPGKVDLGMAGVLVIGGGVAIVSSIPLFIAAGKNKKKGMNMSFRLQEIQLPHSSGFAEKKIPSLSLNLSL